MPLMAVSTPSLADRFLSDLAAGVEAEPIPDAREPKRPNGRPREVAVPRPFLVRLDAHHHDHLTKRAEEEGCSRAALVRRLIDADAKAAS